MSDSRNDRSIDNIDALLNGHFYKLVGKKALPCSFAEYTQSMKSPENRIIEQTPVGDLIVSTIFTGIDHAFGNSPKRLFETTVFNLPEDLQPQWHFASHNEALKQHHELVKSLKNNGQGTLMAEIKKMQIL